jgi:segregation and condensation protein B
MPSQVDELVLKVEAVLFAAGKPLAVKELAAALELEDSAAVRRAVRVLAETYGHRQSALEVRRVGDRYALQLEERFVPVVHAVTPVELAPRTVKALALIAYHQPMLQSVLVRMIGEAAYEEVQHLRGVGLVRTEPKGSTLELTTTRRFAEYFGVPSGESKEIRRFLEQKFGVPPSSAPEVPGGSSTPLGEAVPDSMSGAGNPPRDPPGTAESVAAEPEPTN